MRTAIATAVVAFALVLPMRAEILEQILVKVNGEIFTKTNLEERQIAALRQQNRGVTPEDLRTDEGLKKVLDDMTPQLLLDAVDELLIMQRGKELGYSMGDEQFKNIVDGIRKDNNLESNEAFEAALKQEGMNMADLRRMLERQAIVSRVQQTEVWNRIAVTEGEQKAYYEQHSAEFTTPTTLTLREIFVTIPEGRPAGAAAGPGVNVGLEEEAREKANRLRARALAGDDFARLASTESDAASKANGGLIGPINEEELSPALRQLLGGLKVGDLTQPLRSQRGYQILKLEARTETKKLGFDEAREQISERVFQQKRAGEMVKYLAKIRTQAIIEWKNDEGKKLYDRAVVQQERQLAAAKPAS
ncbi:MAG: peptidylprolyl isomerase [Vicinamibacterales bacterium]